MHKITAEELSTKIEVQVAVTKATGFRELRHGCGLEQFHVGGETQLSAKG